MKEQELEKNILVWGIALAMFVFIIFVINDFGSKSGNVFTVQTDDFLPLTNPYYFCDGSPDLNYDTQDSLTMKNCPKDDSKDSRCKEYTYTDYCVGNNLKEFYCDGRTRGLKIVDCGKFRDGSKCVDGACV